VGNGEDIAHYRLWCVVVDIGFAKLSTGRQPVVKLSAAAAGFLIGGDSLAYRLHSTWKLIGGSSG